MPKTYVDNAYNRSVGRVGMDHGTFVISHGTSSSGTIGCSSSFNVGASSFTHSSTYNHESAPKYYADNTFNRRHERVGLKHGEAVISHGSSSIKATSRLSDSVKYIDSYEPSLTYSGHPENEAYAVKEPIRAREKDTRPLKPYCDNSLNSRLERAGDPVGTAVFPRGSKMSDGTHLETYDDNKMNQKLDRVGMPRGSLPHNPGSKTPTHKKMERSFADLLNGLIDESEPELDDMLMSDGNDNTNLERWRSQDKFKQTHTSTSHSTSHRRPVMAPSLLVTPDKPPTSNVFVTPSRDLEPSVHMDVYQSTPNDQHLEYSDTDDSAEYEVKVTAPEVKVHTPDDEPPTQRLSASSPDDDDTSKESRRVYIPPPGALILPAVVPRLRPTTSDNKPSPKPRNESISTVFDKPALKSVQPPTSKPMEKERDMTFEKPALKSTPKPKRDRTPDNDMDTNTETTKLNNFSPSWMKQGRSPSTPSVTGMTSLTPAISCPTLDSDEVPQWKKDLAQRRQSRKESSPASVQPPTSKPMEKERDMTFEKPALKSTPKPKRDRTPDNDMDTNTETTKHNNFSPSWMKQGRSPSTPSVTGMTSLTPAISCPTLDSDEVPQWKKDLTQRRQSRKESSPADTPRKEDSAEPEWKKNVALRKLRPTATPSKEPKPASMTNGADENDGDADNYDMSPPAKKPSPAMMIPLPGMGTKPPTQRLSASSPDDDDTSKEFRRFFKPPPGAFKLPAVVPRLKPTTSDHKPSPKPRNESNSPVFDKPALKSVQTPTSKPMEKDRDMTFEKPALKSTPKPSKDRTPDDDMDTNTCMFNKPSLRSTPKPKPSERDNKSEDSLDSGIYDTKQFRNTPKREISGTSRSDPQHVFDKPALRSTEQKAKTAEKPSLLQTAASKQAKALTALQAKENHNSSSDKPVPSWLEKTPLRKTATTTPLQDNSNKQSETHISEDIVKQSRERSRGSSTSSDKDTNSKTSTETTKHNNFSPSWMKQGRSPSTPNVTGMTSLTPAISCPTLDSKEVPQWKKDLAQRRQSRKESSPMDTPRKEDSAEPEWKKNVALRKLRPTATPS